MERIGPDQFASLLKAGTPFIDVRAPVEFAEGSIPGAVNAPLMVDDERAAVGTTYKLEGSEAAVALGHRLVNGAVKSARVEAWLRRVSTHPESVLFCFRGGLRSQISQKWLAEAGVQRPLVEGGFKALRRFLRETLAAESRRPFVVVAGATGSGKTEFLNECPGVFLDLERHARHRGSAFGGLGGQPSQIDFENEIAVALLRAPLSARPTLIEDESRMIGQRVVPEEIHACIRSSPMIVLSEPLENRVGRLLRDYILETPVAGSDDAKAAAVFEKYRNAVGAISKKLGGVRTAELLKDLADAEAARQTKDFEINRGWIRKLLQWYYDPMYERGLSKREGPVLFRGTRDEALSWWNTEKNFPSPSPLD